MLHMGPLGCSGETRCSRCNRQLQNAPAPSAFFFFCTRFVHFAGTKKKSTRKLTVLQSFKETKKPEQTSFGQPPFCFGSVIFSNPVLKVFAFAGAAHTHTHTHTQRRCITGSRACRKHWPLHTDKMSLNPSGLINFIQPNY